MFRWRNFVLLALPISILIPLLVWGSVTLYQQTLRDVVSDRDTQAARTAAAALNGQLERRAEVVSGLAEQAAISDDYELLLTSIGFLDTDFDGGIAIFDLSGVPLAVRNVIRDDVIDWPFPRSTANPFSSVAINPQTGEPQMRVVATNERVQVVGAFQPVTLATAVLDATLGEFRPKTTLLDRTGEPLPGLPAVPDDVSTLNTNSIAPVGWTLLTEKSAESSNPRLTALLLAPLILVPVLLIALGAIWFGERQILRPLQQLEQQAAALGQGQFDLIEPDVGGIEAVRSLQSELVQMARKLELAQSNLRTQVGAITQGQEEERRRLARELHDDTIQSLIALNQRVQLSQLRANGDAALSADMTNLQSMIGDLIGDVRRFTHALRPIGLEDLGLIAALELLISNTREISVLDIELTKTGEPRRLIVSDEFALYRIVQEALNNSIQHADATQVLITLTFAADHVTVAIEDDGQGFTVPSSLAEMATIGQFGLLGIHERAELIGADVNIESSSDGTSVSIKIEAGT